MLDLLVALLIIAFATLGLRAGPQPRKRSVLTFTASAGVFAAAYKLLPQTELAAGAPVSDLMIALLTAFAVVFAIRALVGLISKRQARPTDDRTSTGARSGLLHGALVALKVVAVVALDKWPADGINASVASPAYADAADGSAATRLADLAPHPMSNIAPERPPCPVAWTVVPQAPSSGTMRLFTGTARAGERAPLAFEVTGTIVRIKVRVGEQVRRGERACAGKGCPRRRAPCRHWRHTADSCGHLASPQRHLAKAAKLISAPTPS